ncbi:histone H1, orphon-like [Stegodyphus dumicola]|uniref:histone H1, orphon-like n=1 Tax=Stegodyphus dumicola TaxID=202533 RepID=UPI0015B1AFBE|nr:histone H1, orphon-like [Stegodyphus dumicola]
MYEINAQPLNPPASIVMEREDNVTSTQPALATYRESASQDFKEIGPVVLNAIRNLREMKGCSLKDITKFVATKSQLDVKTYNSGIKSFLKKSVENGILTKLGGKYKLRETAGRRRRSRSRKTPKTGVTKRKRSRSRRRATSSKTKGRRRSGRAKRTTKRRRSRRKMHKGHKPGDSCGQ